MKRQNGLQFYKKKKKISPVMIREIVSWFIGCAIMIFLAFVIIFAIGMKTSVIGVSMEPTLSNGQTVFVNRFIYMISNPKVGDVVVFLPNGNTKTQYSLKRVVAVPGDTVQIKNGKLYVNDELSVYSEEFDKIADPGIAENEITLAKNEYFVIGDNCNNSEDSRSGNIGPVPLSTIIGKAWFHLASSTDSIGMISGF